MDSEQLFIRNKIFIKDAVQKKLENIRLSILGCGLASQIAVLAARTGISNFFLSDGDVVELSNLNRQAYSLPSLNKNKAEETKNLITLINSEAKIDILSKNIESEKIDGIVSNSDFIICTIDVGNTYFALAEKIKESKKIGIFPLNIGYGSLIFVISEKSATFKELFTDALPENDFDFYAKLFQKMRNALPEYLISDAEQFFKEYTDKISPPQLGIANYFTSSLVMTIIIDIIEGKTVPKVPQPIYFDIKNLLSNI